MHIGNPPEPFVSGLSERPAPAGFAKPLVAYLAVVALTLTVHGVGAAYGISLFGGQAAGWLAAAGP